MSTLSNYTDRDLEAMAVDRLTWYVSRRGTARGARAADEAADALWELRTREQLSDGRTDVHGNGTAARARASRIYAAVAGGNREVYEQISGAIQRRMTSRRRAWLAQQEGQQS